MLERGVVGRDHANAGTRFDRHVANRHPAFHRHRPDRRAGVLDGMAGGTTDPDLANNGQDDILGSDRRRKRSVDGDPHQARTPEPHGLGRQDVAKLVAAADRNGAGPHRAVRGGCGSRCR